MLSKKASYFKKILIILFERIKCGELERKHVMEYRVLGRTGLRISPICFGTGTFTEPTPEEEAKIMINRALDADINLLGTGNYSLARFRFCPAFTVRNCLSKPVRTAWKH